MAKCARGAVLTREQLVEWDAADPLAMCRARFDLPADIIYLDGNSLGPLPHAVKANLRRTVEVEWARGLITSWNRHQWVDLPEIVGAKIARLIGAETDEVIAADSTSINLFKLIAGALALRPDRRVIVSVADNFPTDLYIADGLVRLLGQGHELRLVTVDALPAAIDQNVALVMLTEVDYRTGTRHDMAAITAAAHAAGALMLWDLAHSAGAFPVALNAAGADLAVGCGYKFLNGGPGAPAFLYVAKQHQVDFHPVLTGWFGHAETFAFAPGYAPAAGVRRMLCGTPSVLALVALDAALDAFADIDLHLVREKSARLAEAFISLVESHCDGFDLLLASPRDAAQRGSQVSFRHAQAYPIMQALIARGMIGDVRTPDILRFGVAPLYLRFVDMWDAAMVLQGVLKREEWRRPEYQTRAKVT
jgi:kynureninase